MSKLVEAIEELEGKIAALGAEIKAAEAVSEPFWKRSEELNKQAIAAQEAARAAADEWNKSLPVDWIKTKKRYGRLCALRMEMLQQLKE